MRRDVLQALVYIVLAAGVLELVLGVVYAVAGHARLLLFVGGISFTVAALFMGFVFDVRPGGDQRRKEEQ